MSKLCEMCGDTANVLCLECCKYLCGGCSAMIHEKEWNKSHKIEPISQNLPVDTKCPEHKEYPMKYFCEDDNGTTSKFRFVTLCYYRIMLL